MANTYRQNMRIDTSDKDMELTTNPCSSDRNCINKGALGKFFRKQDFGKIEKKKKADQETSLMCYLTPKNCEDSTKIIKEKFRENSSELNINNFLSQSFANVSSKQLTNKSSVNLSLVEQATSRMTSIEKGRKETERKMKVTFKESHPKEEKEEIILGREVGSKLKGTGSFRNLKQCDTKREEEQSLLSNIPSSKSISMAYDKEMKKLKNQCEHYSQLLETSTKEKQESINQLKSLNSLVQELKQRNTNLMSEQGDLEKEILQLNTQLTSATNENDQLKQEIKFISEEKVKYQEEISYLKSSIADLNERIDIMLQTTTSSTPRNNKSLTSSTTFSNQKDVPHINKRINSMIYMNRSEDENSQEDLKLIIHELQEQLKYAQVEVNMLKRVKMDINKKNEEFIKLQRQNQILKNQIFDMKMNNAIEEKGFKSPKNGKSQNSNKSGFYPSNTSRNNFQINLQRGARVKDYGNRNKDFDNKSESSDTLSLNLSLSPEKDRFRS